VTSFYSGAMMLRLDHAGGAPSVLWRTTSQSETQTTHLNAIMCTPFLEPEVITAFAAYGNFALCGRTPASGLGNLPATTSGGAVRWANAFIVKNGSRFFLFNENRRPDHAGSTRADTRKSAVPTSWIHEQGLRRRVVWSHRRLRTAGSMCGTTGSWSVRSSPRRCI